MEHRHLSPSRAAGFALEGAAGAAQRLAAFAGGCLGGRGAVGGWCQPRVGAEQRVAPLVQVLIHRLDLPPGVG